MPITRSAKKHLKASKTKRKFNLARLNKMRSLVKDLKDLITQEKLKEAKKILPQVFKAIDKAAKRGIIKDNTGARKKSRLAKVINRLAEK